MHIRDLYCLFPEMNGDDPAVYTYRYEGTVVALIIREGRARLVVAWRGTIKP
jgi:hypothetical protein